MTSSDETIASPHGLADAPHEQPDASEQPAGNVDAAQESTRRMRLTLRWFLTHSVVNAALLAFAPDGLPELRLFMASLMYWACTLPLFIRSYYQHDDIPFIEGVCVAYFFYYGLGVFTDSVYVKRFPFESPEVTDAVGWALLGITLLQLTFYSSVLTPLFGGRNDRVPRLSLPIDLERVGDRFIILAALFLLMSGWALYFKLPTSISTIVGLLGKLPLILLSGTWLLWLRGKLSTGNKFAASIVFIIYCLLGLGRGTLAQVIIAFAPFFFIYMKVRRTLPWKTVVVVVIFLLPFLVTKIEFRKRTWAREDYSAVERVRIFFDITAEAITEPEFAYRALKKSSRRTSYLGVLAYVIQATPSRVPYWNGESYRSMLYTFVPRLFAPDKPKKEFGQRFGHRYRLIHRKDYKTSVNFAQLVEMYANFGKWGIMFGMALVGLFYRTLYMLLNHDEGGDGPTLIAAVTFALLMNIESDASLVLGGTFAAVSIFYVSLSLINLLSARVMAKP